MFKSLGLTLMLATLILLEPITAEASTLSINNWQANGSQMWRIAFDNGASELYYPQSGNYATINFEKPLSPVHKVSLETGLLGSIAPATGSDSDWDYSRSQDLWYYGAFQTGGNSTFVNIDFKHTVNDNTDFFYGYGYSNSHYIMTQGHYSIMDYNPVDTYLPTLNSTYSLVYHGPHVGLISTKQLAPTLALVGSVSYSPLTLVQGHGWWNLRDLAFEHLGTGQMLDGKIGLRYNVAGRQDNALTVGYRYQYYSLFTGSESTSSEISWTKAVKVQHGWYMGGDFKF